MFKQFILVLVCLLSVATIQVTSQRDEDESKTIELELKNTANGGLFYVELGVRVDQQDSESYKKFNLLVGSTYCMTWIPKQHVDMKAHLERQSRLRQSDNYIRKTGARYGEYYYSVHNVTCLIGPQLVEDQPMARAYPTEDCKPLPDEYNIDGVLGLCGYALIPDPTQYLFRNLFHLGHINKLQYSLYINNTASANKTNGQRGTTAGALVLGGINGKYFKGEIKYAKLEEEFECSGFATMAMNRSLIVTKVELDWSRAINWKGQQRDEIERLLTEKRFDLGQAEAHLRLDSSLILFVGPDKLLDYIHLDFIGATKVGTRHFYVFDDCHLDNKPDLVFTVDDLELKVRPEDYVVHEMFDGKKVCISAFVGHPDKLWTFGTNFLRNYYTVFDYEREAIGFATPT